MGLCMAVVPTHAAVAQRDMTAVDMLNMPDLSDGRLSPDGSALLYVQEVSDWDENRRIRHIWRVRIKDGQTVQMTRGKDGETSPRWSPDGQFIAFLAERGDDDRNQIYVLRADGGEAGRLTDHPTRVSNLIWAPDGRSIYFLARDEDDEALKKRKAAKDDIVPFEEPSNHRHIWRVDVTSTQTQRVTGGDFSVRNYALSRDGSRIVHSRAPSMLIDDRHDGELWLMNADGGDGVKLTDNGFMEGDPALSPDNRQILFTSTVNERGAPYYNNNLFLVSASGGETRLLLADMPHEVEQARWSKDGRTILFTANMGVRTELFSFDVRSERLRQLTDGPGTIREWTYSHRADRHVLERRDATNAGDMWLFSGRRGGKSERVTRVFDYLGEQFRLPRQEVVQWPGADGVTVEGLVSYPLDYQPGQRYPLVVKTHGGPRSSDQLGPWRWRAYIPVLTARGYAVLEPNYRGSTGYGDAFMRDMVGQYFRNSHLDVLTGVDHLVEQGLADPDRLVKMGWSAGGHMTNWIITQTDRFKAASSGAGAFDWVSMYGESDTRAYRTPWFGGSPWQQDAPLKVFYDNSPLKYVWRVTTPTLVLVGARDVRVPPSQSVMLHRALKSNGVPTRLFVAPREPHGWRELRHRLFKINAELDWFEKHARDRDYAWERAPDDTETEPAGDASEAEAE